MAPITASHGLRLNLALSLAASMLMAVVLSGAPVMAGEIAMLPVTAALPAAPRALVDDEGIPLASLTAAIPDDVQSQTHHGHYLTAREAYETKNWLGRAVLFVDVRDTKSAPTGVAPGNVDFNLPVTHYWATGKAQVAYGFVGTIKRTLAARGLDHDALVLAICENGRNAALAAELLAQAGIPNVFVVRGGMQGEIGAIANSTGWLSADLPLSRTSTSALASK